MTRRRVSSFLATTVVALLLTATADFVNADADCHAREDGVCVRVNVPDDTPIVRLSVVPLPPSDCHVREDGIC